MRDDEEEKAGSGGVEAHLVEGDTAASGGEGDPREAEEGGGGVWGRGVANPIRARTRAPPGRGRAGSTDR